MGKFLKRTKQQKQKSKQTKRRIKNKLTNMWKGLGQQAGKIFFIEIWDCEDLTKLEAEQKGIKKKIIQTIKLKYKNKMPGYRYKKIIQEIDFFLERHTLGIIDAASINYIREEIKDFYAFRGLKKRARHLTQEQVAAYKEIQEMTETILCITEAGAFREKDRAWISNHLLEDLKASEIEEQQKSMQEFGLT